MTYADKVGILWLYATRYWIYSIIQICSSNNCGADLWEFSSCCYLLVKTATWKFPHGSWLFGIFIRLLSPRLLLNMHRRVFWQRTGENIAHTHIPTHIRTHSLTHAHAYSHTHTHTRTHTHTCTYAHIQKKHKNTHNWREYGVATISRLLKTIGLFCKRAL